jgi:hypothetical protein
VGWLDAYGLAVEDEVGVSVGIGGPGGVVEDIAVEVERLGVA